MEIRGRELCAQAPFVLSQISSQTATNGKSQERERERERRSSHEWFKAEPKKEEGLKPERGESRPTAAVL